MKRKISLNTYRFIDLSIFTILIIVFEIIAVKALNWFSEIYCISLFFAITLIVLMRWGPWSIITIIASAIIYCYQTNGEIENYVVYIIGDLFILLNLLWFLKGKDKFKNTYITISYVITGYLLVEIGRTIVSLFFGYNFISTLIGFLGTDSLNVLLAILIIMITRKQNGIFEDQIVYLKRINVESKKESSLEVNDNEINI